MIRKRSRIERQWIIFRSAFGTTVVLVRGMWRSQSGKWWMVPLIIFLCFNALLLTLAASVEALAPFVYAIF